MSDKTEAIDQERQSVSTPEHTARNAEVSRTVAGFGRSALDRHLRNGKDSSRSSRDLTGEIQKHAAASGDPAQLLLRHWQKLACSVAALGRLLDSVERAVKDTRQAADDSKRQLTATRANFVENLAFIQSRSHEPVVNEISKLVH